MRGTIRGQEVVGGDFNWPTALGGPGKESVTVKALWTSPYTCCFC